jgi:hypothetical protein
MQVELGYGKANLSDMLATYASLRVTAPFKRETAIQTGRRVPGSDNAIPVGKFDLNGALLNAKVDHPTGTIIAVQASWKRRGAPIREAALFFRLREGAALYDVRAKVPLGPDNYCGDSFLIFGGYGDLLTPDELHLHGLEVNRGFKERFMQPVEIGECFVIRQLRAETIHRPTLQAVATSEGVQMREIPAAPGRRLNLRKR